MERMFNNPVQRGFFPDPSVVKVGDDFYMVNSSFQYFPAIPISHSKDCVHWEIIGHAVVDSDYLDLSNTLDSRGIWAPDISYVDGKFVIMATLRLNGAVKDDKTVLRRQLVVFSDKPEGPYTKPVWLEVDDIDPSLFVDEDGKKYMVIAPGISIVPLSDDCTKVIGEKITVWPGTGERCPEGPHLFKKDGYYYAVLAEGGTGYGHGINVGRSTSLYGPYEASPYNPVMRQFDESCIIQRTGHGKLIEIAPDDWWVFYLCGRINHGRYTTIGRESALDKVTWHEDGWFTVNDGNGPSLCAKAPDLPEVVYPKWTMDNFDSDKLNLNWEFVRNPYWGDISLSERPGYLRIYTGNGALNEIGAKNVLLRREQELSYTATLKCEFNPDKEGQQAGLTCYYSTVTYIRFSICYEQGRKLKLVINRNHGEEEISAVDIDSGAIYLQVRVDGLSRSFYYSYDGVNYYPAGTVENCIFLCDEGVPDDPKRHTGTLVGMYATNSGGGSRIPADFDFFEYV